MIEGNEYVEAVRQYFSFLSLEYNMTKTEEKIRGNVFYDVQFCAPTKVISISYENVENYLQVILFKLKNGKLPDYDDKTSTLHLNALNRISFSKASKADIELNNGFFNNLSGVDDFRKKLLKSEGFKVIIKID